MQRKWQVCQPSSWLSQTICKLCQVSFAAATCLQKNDLHAALVVLQQLVLLASLHVACSDTSHCNCCGVHVASSDSLLPCTHLDSLLFSRRVATYLLCSSPSPRPVLHCNLLHPPKHWHVADFATALLVGSNTPNEYDVSGLT